MKPVCMIDLAHTLACLQIEKKAKKGASFWIRATIYPNAQYDVERKEFSLNEGNEV